MSTILVLAEEEVPAPPTSSLLSEQHNGVVANRIVYPKTTAALSTSEQCYILEGCRDDCRSDGRRRLEFRPFTLLTNSDPIIMSHGSSRIFVQQTHVVCSIKAELVHPATHQPTKGAVEIHVDTLMDDPRTRRQTEQQLQSTLTYLLADHIVDMYGLCVVPNQYVWKLNVDLVVLSAKQGSLIDICSRAIRAALINSKLPNLTPINTKQESRGAQVDLAVDSDIQKASMPIGANDCPIVLTVSVLKCPPKGAPVFVLDTTLDEEVCASSQVRVAVKPNGQVCAVLSQGGSLALGILPDVTSTAVQASTAVLEAMKMTVPGDVTPQTLLQEQFQIR